MSVTKVMLLCFFVSIWMLIVAGYFWPQILLGICLSFLCLSMVTAILRGYIQIQPRHKLDNRMGVATFPSRIATALIFLPIFFYEIIHSALKVTMLVIRPDALHPGLIRYDLGLRNPIAVAVLANLITLTPGTMTMCCDLDDNLLFIHALDVNSQASIDQLKASVSSFERWVGRILE